MHQAAESGKAAHTFYKGGLLAGQAARLSAWAQALQPAPGQRDAVSAHAGEERSLPASGAGEGPEARPGLERDAAAVELFRFALAACPLPYFGQGVGM